MNMERIRIKYFLPSHTTSLTKHQAYCCFMLVSLFYPFGTKDKNKLKENLQTQEFIFILDEQSIEKNEGNARVHANDRRLPDRLNHPKGLYRKNSLELFLCFAKFNTYSYAVVKH